PRFGQSDRDRLLRRSCAVLAFAHVMDLFAHELAGLGGGTLALTTIAPGSLERSLLRHAAPPAIGGASRVPATTLSWRRPSPRTTRPGRRRRPTGCRMEESGSAARSCRAPRVPRSPSEENEAGSP